MKKLMFAATALVCGVVFAEGEITSQNIVGYAGNECDTEYGSKMLTPQFVNVGTSTGLKLADIKPVAAGDPSYEFSDGDVDIQFIDNSGFTVPEKVFIWNGSNWYNKKTGADASAFEIPAGFAVQVTSGLGEDPVVTLQSAGQVCTSDVLVTLDLEYGSIAIGNPFPTAVKLGELTLSSDVELSDGDVDIQFIDNSGFTVPEKVFIWSGSNWYNKKTGDDASNYQIEPGIGVQATSGLGEDAVTVRFPAPNLNK